MSPASSDAIVRVIERSVDGLGLDWTRSSAHTVTVTLPGARKLTTACALEVGRHTVNVRAFVARRPEENHEAVHRWLLERNLRLALVGFALDRHGDIHLCGRIPVAVVTPDLVDELLGIIAETADSSFNTILELGFASSIRREWQWRLDRGESTANLAAFDHLRPPEAPPTSSES
ncbi:MAG TPA: YbjN domain-containing protein [Candidatus Avipropionibacterium avicola]|uniref:YbjN domain-containing protein n=1 Tax=Candidatus Avipropionibacterium avicola TaxID=2840701 RepID=A0A9D1KMB0_9ACTN|nr:YbjN domain-containing protein [Candidatus Avipropionibacterium avicola]